MPASTVKKCFVCGTVAVSNSMDGLICDDPTCKNRLAEKVRLLQEKNEELAGDVEELREEKQNLESSDRQTKGKLNEAISTVSECLRGLEDLKVMGLDGLPVGGRK